MQTRFLNNITTFATRGAGITCLLIAISFSATSCKQNAGQSLLAGEVEEQAQRIALLEGQLEKLSAKHQLELDEINSVTAIDKRLLQEAAASEETLKVEQSAAEAELNLLVENPPAPEDTIVLANGKTIDGYIAEYAEGIFTVAMPDGETKRGRSTSFKKIEFYSSLQVDEPLDDPFDDSFDDPFDEML